MIIPGNTSLGEMPDTSWFAGYAQADFHLNPAMYPPSIETAASWMSGDPGNDIDGHSRPGNDGTPDFAGADLVP
ncbi:hypothetical protein ENSA7_61010 [Enhygromyxa salina]|uniref:Uncharacterized protein n=2 Tax=Enhygromyxa salina TaxID=215803 RepID=A0A2S9Y465_9BACT|nr:hypothetical protein ENSA7_61010 [Enhygromyxa salina]